MGEKQGPVRDATVSPLHIHRDELPRGRTSKQRTRRNTQHITYVMHVRMYGFGGLEPAYLIFGERLHVEKKVIHRSRTTT